MRHGCIELWNRFLRHWKFEKYKFSHLFLQILFFTTVDSLADVLALCSMTKILEKRKLVMISKFCHLVLKKKMFFENVWEPWKTCDLRKLPICWLHTEQCGLEWKKFPPSALEPHCGGGGIYLGALRAAHGLQVQKVRGPRRESLQQNTAGQVRLGHRDGWRDVRVLIRFYSASARVSYSENSLTRCWRPSFPKRLSDFSLLLPGFDPLTSCSTQLRVPPVTTQGRCFSCVFTFKILHRPMNADTARIWDRCSNSYKFFVRTLLWKS